MVDRSDDSPAELEELAAEYELLGELGRGSSAIVYHARDRALEREVAIKLVRAELVDDDLLERAAQEARLLARLPHHPHLVTIYAVRQLSRRSLALVVQYVHGPTLRELLRRDGPQPVPRIMRVMRDVGRALHFAHGYGIVHRDVKPENIYVDERSERVLLSDFGAAMLLHQDARLTATGEVIGTPAYMSPEQLDDTAVDARSDLYSLGLIGWEMATGQFPWGTFNLYEVLYRRRHTDLAPVDSLRADLPAPLVNAIERALERDPARRWPNAAALLGALLAPADTPRLASRAAWQPAPAALPAAALPAGQIPTVPYTPAARRVSTVPPAAAADATDTDDTTDTVDTVDPVDRVDTADDRDPSSAPFVATPRERAASPRFTGRATWKRLLAGGVVLAAATMLLFFGGRALQARLTGTDAGTRAVAGEVALEEELVEDLAAAATAVGDSMAGERAPSRDSAPSVDPAPARTPSSAAPPATPRPPATSHADSLARCRSPALADQRACLLARLAEHDAELNAEYVSLIRATRQRAGWRRGEPEPPAVQRLRAEQRGWLVERDRICAQRGRGREGPLWAPQRADCLGDLGRARARELRARQSAAGGA